MASDYTVQAEACILLQKAQQHAWGNTAERKKQWLTERAGILLSVGS